MVDDPERDSACQQCQARRDIARAHAEAGQLEEARGQLDAIVAVRRTHGFDADVDMASFAVLRLMGHGRQAAPWHAPGG